MQAIDRVFFGVALFAIGIAATTLILKLRELMSVLITTVSPNAVLIPVFGVFIVLLLVLASRCDDMEME